MMSQRVRHGGIYETGRALFLCDCCETRRQFATAEAVERHEDGNTPASHQDNGHNGTYNERV